LESDCFWSATKVACAWETAGLVEPLGAPPEPLAAEEGWTEGVTSAVVTALVTLVVDVDDWLVWSPVTLAWADVTVACAWTTALWREVVSRVARACPAVTTWPTVTATVATVPEVPKLRLAWLSGVRVPTASRVWTGEPVVTVASR
jgi:hypothetical protein